MRWRASLLDCTEPFTMTTHARERYVIHFCNAAASFSRKTQARLNDKSSAAQSL